MHSTKDTNNNDKLKKTNTIVYKNGDLIFFNYFADINTPEVFLSEMYMAGLVLEGTATVKINNIEHEFRKGDLFISLPSNVIETLKKSEDLKVNGTLLKRKYIQRMLPLSDTSYAWDFKKILEKTPVFPLQPEEMEMCCKFFDLICTKTSLPPANQEVMVDGLMIVFSYYTKNILRRFVKPSDITYTSGEGHFKKFIEMLESTSPKNRNLGYYAELLNVTPKYLSGICKRLTGQTASKLIAAYVVKDIEYRLRFSQKSIKEIAFEMDFPTLSFFGRYVKKHLGMSPKEFREQHRKRIKG